MVSEPNKCKTVFSQLKCQRGQLSWVKLAKSEELAVKNRKIDHFGMRICGKYVNCKKLRLRPRHHRRHQNFERIQSELANEDLMRIYSVKARYL